jgi:hypothetical protein
VGGHSGGTTSVDASSDANGPTTTSGNSSDPNDQGFCSASRATASLSVAQPTAAAVDAAQHSNASAEGITRRNYPEVGSTPGAAVKSFYANVSDPSPADSAVLGLSQIVQRPVWVVEVSGLSLPFIGKHAESTVTTSNIRFTHLVDFIDDATGLEFTTLMCP